MLKLKDLIEGEFYFANSNYYSAIYKYRKNNLRKNGPETTYYHGIYSHDKYLHNTDGFLLHTQNLTDLRLATLQEREHLEQCIAADKYVDYKPTKQELIFKMII